MIVLRCSGCGEPDVRGIDSSVGGRVAVKRIVVIVVVVLLVAGLLVSVPYSVDQSEFAYVTQFGRPVDTIDGAEDAGLHFKLPWPIQSVQRIDRRLQMFDLTGA